MKSVEMAATKGLAKRLFHGPREKYCVPLDPVKIERSKYIKRR